MNDNIIFETLKELSDNQRSQIKNKNVDKSNTKKDNQTSKRKDPSYIYLEDNQVKERKLSELLDSAGSVYINKVMNYKSLNLIHDSIFGI